MKITDLLDIKSISLHNNVKTKQESIDTLVGLLDQSNKLNDVEEFKKAVLKREEQSTTGIGQGIAIPHGQSTSVKKAGLAAMVVEDGVDFDSLDGQPAKLFFMIAAPVGEENIHLKALAKLSGFLMDEQFYNDLLNAQTEKEFLSIIDQKEKSEDSSVGTTEDVYRVLAVTACPTGIAHTFMAAESLEKAGKALGIPVKVETNGADGAQNILTQEDIDKADGIIIAADKNVSMARFDGKPLISTTVSQGISKAEELVTKITDGKATVYHHDGEVSQSDTGESDSIGHTIYKHLMNGVSHMLPFVIGGGILIALAFLVDDYSINPANFGKNTPLAFYLKTIGDVAFDMMLPVLAGYIAMSIADRPGLAVGFVGGLIAKMGSTFANPAGGEVNAGFLGALFAGFVGGYIVLLLKKLFKKLPASLEGIKPTLLYPVLGILLVSVITTFVNPFMGTINDGLSNGLNQMGGSSKILLGFVVGAMMSVDMGGPMNKAAYVFATSQLAEGQFEIMAAVMAGGMIPPLAIALSTTFFKNRYTEEERHSGLVNYILGLSFITEGAIPFAAKDPLRVIPAGVIGSGITGALTMFFGCTLRAPHGGIFVLPTIGNPLMFAIALLVGSVAGCLVLSILKKPIE